MTELKYKSSTGQVSKSGLMVQLTSAYGHMVSKRVMETRISSMRGIDIKDIGGQG